MSQFNLETPSITASTTTGTELASDLSNWRTALHTSHSGSSVPPYAVAGMQWYDSTLGLLKVYDGVNSIATLVVDAVGNIAYPFSQNPRFNFPITGGSADVRTLTLSPALSAYVDGDVFTFESSLSNTAGTTLNINGVGAKGIRKIVGGTDLPLSAGDLVIGRRYIANYDSAAAGAAGGLVLLNPSTVPNWEIIGPTPTLTFTDTDTGADSRVSASSTAGSLVLEADLNNEVANTSLIFQVDGARVGRFNNNGSLFIGDAAYTGAIAEVGAQVQGLGGSSPGAISVTVGGSAAHFMNRRTSNGNIMEFFRQEVFVGSISVTGSATAYNTSSDGRLKDNQQPLQDVGAIIDALQPKSYTWNHTTPPIDGVGFIAQELVAVLPDCVSAGDDDPLKRPGDDGFQQWSASWTSIVPYLVAEIKALRARVAALEAAP